MAATRIHYRRTTAQQRKLLFEKWEETGNVSEACRKAHVGRGTFYYWQARFEEKGSDGLEEFEDHAPNNPNRIEEKVERAVIEMKQDHQNWGKKRIAHELAKKNNWVPVVSPNTVKRVLKEAGLWARIEEEAKKKVNPTASRTAEQPEQTLNVDLCFVPASHEVSQKIPAVSGSSGRLVVARPKEDQERDWPGRVFEDEGLSYEEAMLQFVAASQAKEEGTAPQDPEEKKGLTEPISAKATRQLLKKEEKQLQNDRRQVREQRKLEDLAWQEARKKRKEQVEAYQSLSQTERREQRHVKQVQDEQWPLIRQQRRDTLEKRGQEDVDWRQKRNALRERLSGLPVVTCWIAILVIVDNCTRQCLSLPLFVAGPKVTADMVVEALRVLLPPELQFLISDRGTHFKADVFKMLRLSAEFIHVFIARHRPQSNGVAERFVQTLKEWLADKSWSDDPELAALLRQFLDEYNDRPHQGLPIPGLSPNEFANRIWLM